MVKFVLEAKEGDLNDAHRTIFEEIRDSDLPKEEKQPQRLMIEAVVLIGAGTDTTARALATITFFLTENKNVYERLFEELKVAMPSVDYPITSVELEQLPYLVSQYYIS